MGTHKGCPYGGVPGLGGNVSGPQLVELPGCMGRNANGFWSLIWLGAIERLRICVALCGKAVSLRWSSAIE